MAQGYHCVGAKYSLYMDGYNMLIYKKLIYLRYKALKIFVIKINELTECTLLVEFW